MAKTESVDNGLKFEVVSACLIDSPEQYVEYTIKIQNNVHNSEDSFISRRYSDFLELYSKLQLEFPDIFKSFSFPRKAVIRNFSPALISHRSAGFESLLLLIAQNEKLRESSSVLKFFQNKEKQEIVKLLSRKEYYQAVPLIQLNFHLLNKLFTNRHPKVLQALCLLVACCDVGQDTETQQLAHTAVCRFEAVSDIDSLQYYVPLLQLYMRVMDDSSPERKIIKERLDCMKRRGIKVYGCPFLLDAVLTDYMPSTTK